MMPGVTHPLWPLFDLRLRASSPEIGQIELRLPTQDEHLELSAVAKAGIHPPDEMPFGIAWTDKPSPRFEREAFQHHLLQIATWRPEDWRLLLGVWVEGRIAGVQEIGADDFAHERLVRTGSWLGRSFQGRGMGKLMRQAVLALAFDHLGAEVAESAGFLDNPQSLGVSRAVGYLDNGIGRLAPRGEPRDLQRFRMTLVEWRGRRRPTVEVEGLEGCLELFGVPATTEHRESVTG